jgi:hypothetical protein
VPSRARHQPRPTLRHLAAISALALITSLPPSHSTAQIPPPATTTPPPPNTQPPANTPPANSPPSTTPPVKPRPTNFVRLTTKEGLTYEGELVRAANELILTNPTGQSRFRPWQISKLESLDGFERRLQQQLILLDPRDTASRYNLIPDLRSRGRDDLALEVLNQITRAAPLDEYAYKLIATITEANSPPDSANANSATTRPTSRPGAATRPQSQSELRPGTRLVRPPLPAADINRIRQAELSHTETNIPLRFLNDVERRFARQTAIPMSDLRAQRPLDRFLAIRNTRDPLLLADVLVTRDPRSVATFRRTVQPIILAGCAAAGCHSGGGSADPVLFNPAESDSATYTNFFLLSTAMAAAEVREDMPLASRPPAATDSAASRQRLIDRINPRQSLILQYGLPRDVADWPHPPVPLFRPAFNSREDRRYQTVLDFIARDLSPFEPNYGVTLPQPVVMNTTSQSPPPPPSPEKQTAHP